MATVSGGSRRSSSLSTSSTSPSQGQHVDHPTAIAVETWRALPCGRLAQQGLLALARAPAEALLAGLLLA